MVGPGDGERHDHLEGAAILGRRHRFEDPGPVARDDDLAGAVEVGDIDIELLRDGRHLLRRAADKGRHRPLRPVARLLHEPSPFRHDLQAGLEIKGFGRRQGGQFAEAEAEAGAKIRQLSALAEKGVDRIPHDVERGLAHPGFGQLGLMAFKANAGERPAERRVGAFIELARDGRSLGERFPHADLLRALPAKE